MQYIQLYKWPFVLFCFFFNAMRSLANLIIVSFATSPINQRISQSGSVDQPVNQSIKSSLEWRRGSLIWVLGAFYFNFGPMGGGGGEEEGEVIQRWCHVYTTYRCQGNGVRAREQLPWRLTTTTTTTYKNHQGNRENICKKEMMNQNK